MATRNHADTSLYESLGIDPKSEDVLALSMKEIARAYRRAALRWHPDKNLGDPLAVKRFSRLFVAYETLSNPEKRKTYDDRIRAERQRRQRYEQQDAERRKLRDDLEMRETMSETPIWTDGGIDMATMERMQNEIERLRKEAAADERKAFHAISKRTELKKKDRDKNAGEWANVDGYKALCSSSDLSFEVFEEAILNGQSPF